MKRRSKILLGLAALLVIGFSAVVIYSVLFLHFVVVPTGSMQNTILPGDRIVTNRMVGEIQRGDIVVFRYPGDRTVQYMQRVIGLPGEEIEFRGYRVFIDGNELPECRAFVEPAQPDSAPLKEVSSEGEGPYKVFYEKQSEDERAAGNSAMKFGNNAAYRIPERHYFVLGDNRDNSEDSRFWGTVPRDLVTGKALWIYFSAERKPVPAGAEDDKIRWRRIFTRIK